MDQFLLTIEEAKLEKAREDYALVKSFTFVRLYGGEHEREATLQAVQMRAFARKRLEKAYNRYQEYSNLDLGGGG